MIVVAQCGKAGIDLFRRYITGKRQAIKQAFAVQQQIFPIRRPVRRFKEIRRLPHHTHLPGADVEDFDGAAHSASRGVSVFSFKALGNADIPFAFAMALIMILGRQAPSCKFKPEKTPAPRHRPRRLPFLPNPRFRDEYHRRSRHPLRPDRRNASCQKYRKSP
ncbi:conserved hypothetical protein [Agrobacterium tumefaciens str. CFBP 5621]|nr:conserved hypothetical protein [Agrobacterium tumefaciens str. CFBP 5621]